MHQIPKPIIEQDKQQLKPMWSKKRLRRKLQIAEDFSLYNKEEN
jgi:hypothetical protein